MSDLPDEIRRLCRIDTPITDLRLGEWSCYFKTLGLELRFVKTVTGEWEWDEIVGDCNVHVEMMADNYYWIGFYGDGGRVCVDIGARRAPVRMTGWTEDDNWEPACESSEGRTE